VTPDADETLGPLAEQHDAVATRADLARCGDALRDDRPAHPTWWEHTDLGAYFDALASVVRSLNQRVVPARETLPLQPTWRLAADVLLAARLDA